MEFGRVLTRAWEITWRWKVLWVLGFLAGLGSWSGGGGNSGVRFSGDQIPGRGFPNINIPPELGPVFVGLACLALIAGIVLWVLSIIARGGLIAGVQQVEERGSTTLGSAWAVGQRRFWTLFGIGVLVAIPIIILILIAVAGAFATLVPWFTVAGPGDRGAGSTVLAVFLACCFGLYICGTVIVALALEAIRIYAERAAILEGLNWTAAFSRGWQVLRANLGPTIILWLIFLVLAIIFAIVTGIILLPLLLPFLAIMRQDGGGGAWWVVLCGGGLIALVVGAIVNSIVQVFISASWTLAFRELTGRAPVSPATPPVPPAPVIGEG